MKILKANNKNFDKSLDILLSKRKNKVHSNTASVNNIIKDVRKNGDKVLANQLLNKLPIIIFFDGSGIED